LEHVRERLQGIKVQNKHAPRAPFTRTASYSPMNPLAGLINIHVNSVHVAPLSGPCYVECVRECWSVFHTSQVPPLPRTVWVCAGGIQRNADYSCTLGHSSVSYWFYQQVTKLYEKRIYSFECMS
jgi:hypothetical protein